MPAFACLAAVAAVWAAEGQPQSEAAPTEPDEIVVTGERIPRTIRQTASSVAVFNEEDVEASGANRVDQILALIPNVQLGNGTQGPAIRGLDTTGPLAALPAFLGGNRPRTTIIVDGRPVTYNEFVFGTFPLWDLNRVEVFRSPQTTTQGQNSIAGAIFVNTNDASFQPEYRARGIIGDFKLRQASLLASGPIAGDDVAFRVAGDIRYSHTTSDIRDTMEDADPNHDVYGLFRAKLLANPTPATRLALTYTHTQSQAPQIVGVTAPFSERRDENGFYGVFRINVDSLTSTIRHQVGSNLTANILITAGDSKARRLASPGFGQTRIDGRDWSAEAIFDWLPNEPLHIVGGISHTHLALKQFINLSGLSGAIGRFRDWQDGTGLFADAEISLTSQATATLGIRYQRDRQERRGALAANTFSVPVDFIGEFDAWLPKLTFAYDVTPRLRLGAMVQKAYNPGGTTIRVDTLRPDNFKAETLWDYELFARAELADGRATATANLFYYDMRNAQRSKGVIIFTPSGQGVGFSNLFNIPKARSYGAEAQLNWRANEKLSATIAAGLLYSKIVETDAESADWDGNDFNRAPHFTGAAAIDWRPGDRWRLSVQLRHRGPYYSDPENSSELRVDSGTNVDIRAEHSFKRVVIFGQVRNLFDTLNMLDIGDPDFGEAEDPRTFAIGLESRF